MGALFCALSPTDRKDLAHFITDFTEKHAFEDRVELEIFLRACHEHGINAFEPIAKAKVGKATNPIDTKRESRLWNWICSKISSAKSWWYGNKVTKEQILSDYLAHQFSTNYEACEHAMEKGDLAYIKNVVDQYNAQADSSVQMQEYADMMNKLLEEAQEQVAQQPGPSTASTDTQELDDIILSDQAPSAAQTEEIATDFVMTHAELMSQFEKSISACNSARDIYNELGLTKEAMLASNIADSIENLLNSFDPSKESIESFTGSEEFAASIDDILQKIRTFQTGAMLGAAKGITDLPAMYNGLCNSLKGLSQLAHWYSEKLNNAQKLRDAYNSGDFDRFIQTTQEQSEQVKQSQRNLEHLFQKFDAFVKNVPNPHIS